MINTIIAQVLNEHTQIICNRVKARWASMSAIVGQEEIHSDIPVIVGNMVMVTLESSGMAAFIKEFGSGHTLDESSPYFAEYKSSPMWNPERTADGNEFIGRSAGSTVYRPDGTTSTSTGKAEGLRLEHDIGKTGRYPGYKAFMPTHVIRDEVLQELPDIIAHIQSATAEYIAAQLTMDVQIYI